MLGWCSGKSFNQCIGPVHDICVSRWTPSLKSNLGSSLSGPSYRPAGDLCPVYLVVVHFTNGHTPSVLVDCQFGTLRLRFPVMHMVLQVYNLDYIQHW